MGRVRTRRSHLVELGVLVLTATVAAAVGVLLIARLGPVGLDPSAIAAPALQLRLRATGLTVLLVAAVACAVVGAAATRGKDRADEGGRVLRADG
jgi:hypothetical protein